MKITDLKFFPSLIAILAGKTIIVDTSRPSLIESPELVDACKTKVIIDHHIKKEEFSEKPALAYIDTSASSACELIAEMLEENGYDGNCPFAKGDSFAVLEGGEEFKKKYTKILTEFLFDCHDWFNK